MATSNAWLSVMVKSCSTIVKPRNIVKCSWEDNFRSLLEKMDMPKGTAINKIQISSNEKFIDPVHVVPESAPLSLCNQFKCMFVCIHTEGAEGAPVSTATPVNALQLLLEKAQDQIKELKTLYAIVYPICFLCLSDGKSPHCKHPSNVAKKRKTR